MLKSLAKRNVNKARLKQYFTKNKKVKRLKIKNKKHLK